MQFRHQYIFYVVELFLLQMFQNQFQNRFVFVHILDEIIPRRINSFTGLGYDPDVILPYSMINSPNPNYAPSRFRRPRTVELGMQFYF